MENTLSAIEGCSFVRGFIFNLPPGANYPLRSPAHVVDPMPGTLCGPPTQDQMNRALRFWYRHIDRQRHVIIGSGGVRTAEDAYEKIRLGASLVQIYTAASLPRTRAVLSRSTEVSSVCSSAMDWRRLDRPLDWTTTVRRLYRKSALSAQRPTGRTFPTAGFLLLFHKGNPQRAIAHFVLLWRLERTGRRVDCIRL